MLRDLVTINSRKYDRSISRSWQCSLLEQNQNLLIFVGIFDEDVSHPHLGTIKRGTISYELYRLDCWYNIFCFYEPDGTFRNYYCNINMPPVVEKGVLDFVDLDIDVIVWPDYRFEIIDESEYEQNSLRFLYPEYVRAKASEALADLISIIKNRQLPDVSKFLL